MYTYNRRYKNYVNTIKIMTLNSVIVFTELISKSNNIIYLF